MKRMLLSFYDGSLAIRLRSTFVLFSKSLIGLCIDDESKYKNIDALPLSLTVDLS